jgi:hypothetical protein
MLQQWMRRVSFEIGQASATAAQSSAAIAKALIIPAIQSKFVT